MQQEETQQEEYTRRSTSGQVRQQYPAASDVVAGEDATRGLDQEVAHVLASSGTPLRARG